MWKLCRQRRWPLYTPKTSILRSIAFGVFCSKLLQRRHYCARLWSALLARLCSALPPEGCCALFRSAAGEIFVCLLIASFLFLTYSSTWRLERREVRLSPRAFFISLRDISGVTWGRSWPRKGSGIGPLLITEYCLYFTQVRYVHTWCINGISFATHNVLFLDIRQSRMSLSGVPNTNPELWCNARTECKYTWWSTRRVFVCVDAFHGYSIGLGSQPLLSSTRCAPRVLLVVSWWGLWVRCCRLCVKGDGMR